MSESQNHPEDEALSRAASLLAQALVELQRSSANESFVSDARRELAASRSTIEALAARFERQLSEDTEQRLLLVTQLTNLATSLDSLISHLQALSEVVTSLVASANTPEPTPPAVSPKSTEPPFRPGGEGITLSIAALPGFQALMDIQKALNALDAVSGASVERFQEGDSRVLVHLESPVTASELASSLRAATNLNLAVEESRPEIMSLRLKVVATS